MTPKSAFRILFQCAGIISIAAICALLAFLFAGKPHLALIPFCIGIFSLAFCCSYLTAPSFGHESHEENQEKT